MTKSIEFTLSIATKVRDHYEEEFKGNMYSLAGGGKISVRDVRIEACPNGKFMVAVLYGGKKEKLFLTDLETFLKSIKKTFDLRLLNE